jgi:DNA-binding response OmpR family regulator
LLKCRSDKGGSVERKTVLLADDSNTILMMEKMLLAREPYDLVIAKDGQEAYDKALSSKPDLIVLDVVMPKLTGFEVCQKLREHELTRATPILLMTTRGEGENVQKGYAAGCSDYLTKPIDGPEFLAKVRNHLAKNEGRS